jgi:ubiquinone/menaquinone biosynthesis C-methylase UbiE
MASQQEPDQKLLKLIEQQFDYSPYPVTDISSLPTDRASLYYHSISTAFYRRNRAIVEPKGKTILDVGCGSGYKTLLLALANPGAKIVGVDLSDRSLDLARQRFAYHNQETEFHQLSLFDLPHKILYDFDYINCDEILYLMPDPIAALLAMKLMLKPEGILRANLHSVFQRSHYYRAQRVFQIMGLMDENPEEEAIADVVATFRAFKPNVDLKKTWKPAYEGQHQQHGILMNYLFQGDKGFSIPDLFELLRCAQMQFISMVNWRQWNLFDLFDLTQQFPSILGKVSGFSTEQLLHLFELCHPVYRLLDFWCGHPIDQVEWNPVGDAMAVEDKELTGKVYLHPEIRRVEYKSFVMEHIENYLPCDFNRLIPLQEQQFIIDSTCAAALLPLWDGAQDVEAIARNWQELHPVDPISKKPTTEQEAIKVISSLLRELESAGYIFLG